MDNPSPNSWNSVRQVIGPHGLLSVLMPAFNLEKAIAANVRRVHALFAGQVPFEIVVINDGSRDGTAGELRRLQSEIPELHPVLLPRNVGKGAALRAGFEAARGTISSFSTPTSTCLPARSPNSSASWPRNTPMSSSAPSSTPIRASPTPGSAGS